MTPIERYNAARDREQHAFELSPVGEVYRLCANGYFARILPPEERQRFYDMRTELAALVAFEGSMSAFYALRSIIAANGARA